MIEKILRLTILITFQFISVGWETHDDYLYNMQAEGLRFLFSVNSLIMFIYCLLTILMVGANATLVITLFVEKPPLWIKLIPVIILQSALAFIYFVGYPSLVINTILCIFIALSLLYVIYILFKAWATAPVSA